jgi:hypothetical protein
MIEVKITEEMKQRAWRKAREMGKLNNSITKGEGNISGFIGEEVANSLIEGVVTNTYDYDITSGDQQLITWDVKTKRCTSPPRDYYDCSVAAFNTKQNCDRYVFVRVMFTKNRWGPAWVLGWYDKNKYFKDARFLKKGQIDPDNNFKVKADCYNISIKDLKKL